MAHSKKAIAADAAHIRRMKKLTPKARFKSLSKVDQYVIAARTLAYHWESEKKRLGRARLVSGFHFTITELKSSYIDLDPHTGLLTHRSKLKIKRAVSRALMSSLGKDALILFSIEQRNKEGTLIEPHVHGLFVSKFVNFYHRDLEERLLKISGSHAPGIVQIRPYTRIAKIATEHANSEGAARKLALYHAKNDDTWFYRSRALIRLVHDRFEELKRHHTRH